MGWLFTQGQTKAELIRHLTEGDSKLLTRRKCIRGSTLWAIQENAGHPELGPFIVAYLLHKQPGYGWGYKPVEESMGPAETSCPVSYLDEVPMPDSPHAEGWRARVRARHTEKRNHSRTIKDAAIGDRVMLVQGVRPRFLVLTSKKPLIGKTDDGSQWRIAPKLIETIGSS